jgi:hypothetical protein
MTSRQTAGGVEKNGESRKRNVDPNRANVRAALNPGMHFGDEDFKRVGAPRLFATTLCHHFLQLKSAGHSLELHFVNLVRAIRISE